jgi:thiol-disulfide isomerase/thioredoxin
MKVARPRLLVASLVVAAFVIGGFVWVTSRDSGDGEIDAVLRDPQDVQAFPTDGLANDDVQGDPFPSAVFLDRDGNEVTSESLLGEPLVVNLWFSSCAPCAKELPAFAKVDADVDDVRFIGVNTIDSVADMERFAGDRGVKYDLLRDNYADLADGIGAVAFPITLFVDSQGMIVDQTGPLDEGELRTKVAALEAHEAST